MAVTNLVGYIAYVNAHGEIVGIGANEARTREFWCLLCVEREEVENPEDNLIPVGHEQIKPYSQDCHHCHRQIVDGVKKARGRRDPLNLFEKEWVHPNRCTGRPGLHHGADATCPLCKDKKDNTMDKILEEMR
jgi:hypothetical protein